MDARQQGADPRRWRPDDLEARFGAHYALALEYVSAPDNPNDWARGPDPIQDVYLVDVEVPERGALRGRLVEAGSGRFVETVPLGDDTPLGLAVAEMLADGTEPGEVLVRDLHYDPVSDTLSFDAREALAARFIAQGQDVVEIETRRSSARATTWRAPTPRRPFASSTSRSAAGRCPSGRSRASRRRRA